MAKKTGTALITGASSGIGEELARIHAEKGGDLVLIARRSGRLEAIKAELEAEHGVSVLPLVEDLSDENAPRRIYDRVKAEGIEIAFLMNNAGFGGRGRFDERNWAADRAMIEVNIVAVTALTRAFLPDFVARDTGRILNTSSTAALMPGPLQAVYFATKAYVTSFSNAIAGELAETNVTVTALMPGATKTEFAKTSGMDKTSLFDNTFSARDVAEAGYAGMMAGKLDVIAGVTLAQRILLPLAGLFPKRMILRMVYAAQSVETP